ncbi:MAG: hypothetical protein KDA90_20905 [Planctomycetaceae bacterium]|nr:hypothetical protein [Planctomycetaceae bacterium]
MSHLTGTLMNYDAVISLGGNCAPAWHLKRLGITAESYPFDASFTDHTTLLSVLNADFADTFSSEITITCRRTGFQFGHQPGRELGKRIRKRLERRIQRFRELRNLRSILFIRHYPRNSQSERELLVSHHTELLDCLVRYGMPRFRLVFSTQSFSPPIQHPDFYPLLRSDLPPVQNRWRGNDQDWNDFLDAILGP